MYVDLLDKKVWTFKEFISYSGIRMFDEASCTCSDYSQYTMCHHVQSRLLVEGLIPKPVFLCSLANQKALSERKSDDTVRNIITVTFCAVCTTDCQNEFSLQTHLQGKTHRGNVAKLLPLVRSRQPIDVWQKYILEYCQAKDVAKGDIILIITELTLVQAKVTGITVHGEEMSTHVQTLEGTEAVVLGRSPVARVCDTPLSPFELQRQKTMKRNAVVFKETLGYSPGKPNPLMADEKKKVNTLRNM